VSEDALFWLAIASLGFTCLAAIGARTLREFSRHELQELGEKYDEQDRFGEILRKHDRVALAIESLVTITSALTVGAGVLWAVERWADYEHLTWFIIVGSSAAWGLALCAVTLWIPWSIARIGAASFLFSTWWAWRALGALASPLTWGALFIDTLFHRLAGKAPNVADEESFEEEIRSIVTEGHREGLLEEEAREMIEGVMELGDANVSQIMTPRTDMLMLQLDLAWDRMLTEVIAAGHTRIPVYDKTRDDIVGVLYVKDLLPEFAKGADTPRRRLRDIIRKPLFVPETKAVDDLLQMFQKMRTHIAIVLDEYGGVSGLVSIEDVLEEIVGEIVDEYDAEVEQEIFPGGEDVCEALGRAHVDEINEAMGLELPEDGDYDTIGGFVFSELGRVPTAGESVLWQDSVRVTVLAATRRRIDRVRIERVAATNRESA
jgi:CBS domain containing-hemolysin-like protein